MAHSTLDHISPTRGVVAGGTEVTLTGTMLGDVTDLSLGGTPVSFILDSPTSIRFTTPAHSAGLVGLAAEYTPVPMGLIPEDAGTVTHVLISASALLDTKELAWSDQGPVPKIALASLDFPNGAKAEGAGPFSAGHFFNLVSLATSPGGANWMATFIFKGAIHNYDTFFAEGTWGGSGFLVRNQDGYNNFNLSPSFGANWVHTQDTAVHVLTLGRRAGDLVWKLDWGADTVLAGAGPGYVPNPSPGTGPRIGINMVNGDPWTGSFYEYHFSLTTPTDDILNALHNTIMGTLLLSKYWTGYTLIRNAPFVSTPNIGYTQGGFRFSLPATKTVTRLLIQTKTHAAINHNTSNFVRVRICGDDGTGKPNLSNVLATNNDVAGMPPSGDTLWTMQVDFATPPVLTANTRYHVVADLQGPIGSVDVYTMDYDADPNDDFAAEWWNGSTWTVSDVNCPALQIWGY